MQILNLTVKIEKKFLHSNDFLMELPVQIVSNDQAIRINTIQDLKEFNSQSLATQAEKREQLVSMMPAIKKASDLIGDDIVELSTEIESLKNKIGSYDEKCLEDSKAKLLKQIDEEKKGNFLCLDCRNG